MLFKQSIAGAVAASLMWFATSALAVSATSTAFIDAGSFAVSGGTVTFTGDEFFTADAETPFQFDDDADFIPVDASLTDIYGNGSAFADAFSGDVATAVNVEDAGFADAYASQDFGFTADQTGTLNFSALYEIFVELLDTVDPFAFAQGGVELWVENLVTKTQDTSVIGFGDQAPFSVLDNGELSLDMDFADGDEGYATLVAYSSVDTNVSAVPVPPAAVLFVSGLLGMVSIGRRRLTNVR